MKKIWITTTLFFVFIFVAWYAVIKVGKKHVSANKPPGSIITPIAPSKTHARYWAKNGENIMLLGGSDEDNLFQMKDVQNQLDLLKSVGGNYVRNTMSSRDRGNLWAFGKNVEGLYDLNTWDDGYWTRLDEFLNACEAREIIVQLELWATFDFYREYWEINPFNPKNNINYTAERSHLPLEVPSHPTWTENNFFWSIPSQENNLIVLGYQQKFIDKILSYTLKYHNVLYCMDNETSVTSEWGRFWSAYIKQVAHEQGKQIFTTEMWDPWNLDHVVHRETLDHPEVYEFGDISQNNHNSGDRHWENGIAQIARLKKNGHLRPLNNVKVYGNDGGRHQTTQNAIESFVRNVLLGAASTRFHRPTSGQGLNETAQSIIASTRSYVDSADFFNAQPANDLLLDRASDEAYCRAIKNQEYAIFFPKGGQVSLDIEVKIKDISIRWIDLQKSEWSESRAEINKSNKIIVKSPEGRNWLAFIKLN
jgi:hypothetical protein